MPSSAYVHIPFCSHKCDFCDFTAFAGLDHMAEQYCRVVCQEIRQRVSLLPEVRPLVSVFYGGGTPGLIDPLLLRQIHETLRQFPGIAADAEVTLETTPPAVTQSKAGQWLDIGINRISIGVQSLQDNELDAMGRGHTRQQALEGIEAARAGGFTNLNCDLMYGLPQQTMESWQNTLNDVLALGLPHLSAYGLTLAGNSPLLSKFPRESAAYPPEEVFASMYELLVDCAQNCGLERYEISNFCRPGFESRHNLACWNNEEYLAFGVGAHRYVDGKRSSNWRSLNRYLKDWMGLETCEAIAPETATQEAIFLGLRTAAGIDLESFKGRYGLDLQAARGKTISRLVDGGFLDLADGRLSLSRKGILVSNLVLSELM